MINNFKMIDISRKAPRKCTKCDNEAAVKIKVSKMPKSFLCEKCVADLFEHVSIILREE